MSALMCPNCADGQVEYQASAGNSVCTTCGAVLEENAIVSEIMFGESSNGAAIVQGSYVGADQVRARAPAGYRSRGSGESREQTLANGKKEIRALAAGLNLSENMADAGHRYFMLAVNQGFTQGRRTKYVVAACLYSACRMNQTSHMLIDFSDLLQINVFVLGATYLKLIKHLNINLPTIDPSVYISRFAALLEFGDETQKVAQDATRLVARMGRDWIQHGRRPAGICGACLYLAARMNNFRRSLLEIVQVVKIADVTLRKRLAEFQSTASGQLSVEDFRSLWLEESADPPAFSQSQQQQEKDRPLRLNKKRKRDQTEPLTTEEQEGAQAMLELAGGEQQNNQRGPSADPDDNEEEQDDREANKTLEAHVPENPLFDEAMQVEFRQALETAEGRQMADEVDRVENERALVLRAMTPAPVANAGEEPGDPLANLDEDELDQFILTPEEADAKSRLWMELNRDYLQILADKQLTAEGELKPQTFRKPRKRTKPRDSTNAAGATAAEATRAMLAKKKYSKKINYSVFDDVFAKGGKGRTASPSGSVVGGSSSGRGLIGRRSETPQHFPEPPWSRSRMSSVSTTARAPSAAIDEDDDDDDDGRQASERPGQQDGGEMDWRKEIRWANTEDQEEDYGEEL